jgi:hypothetical protein
MAPKTWVRAFFSEFHRCDLLINNSCEVFNKYTLDARDQNADLSIIMKIKDQLMGRVYNKQKMFMRSGHALYVNMSQD